MFSHHSPTVGGLLAEEIRLGVEIVHERLHVPHDQLELGGGEAHAREYLVDAHHEADQVDTAVDQAGRNRFLKVHRLGNQFPGVQLTQHLMRLLGLGILNLRKGIRNLTLGQKA